MNLQAVLLCSILSPIDAALESDEIGNVILIGITDRFYHCACRALIYVNQLNRSSCERPHRATRPRRNVDAKDLTRSAVRAKCYDAAEVLRARFLAGALL